MVIILGNYAGKHIIIYRSYTKNWNTIINNSNYPEVFEEVDFSFMADLIMT